jgi:hypothetical protein
VEVTSGDATPVSVRVLRTDEELMIARSAFRLRGPGWRRREPEP